jgi:hypothetical protein
MTQIQIREKVLAMNLQINSQLKRAGVLNSKGKNIKSLDSLPDSEWKTWMFDLISVRDYLDNLIN